MNPRDAFVQAILAHPADRGLRLVYADWLEEQGDPQAELFRLQYALTHSATVKKQRYAWAARQQQLLAAGVPPAVIHAVARSLEMKFSLIPQGQFFMGSPAAEFWRGEGLSEELHLVHLTRPFFLGVWQVTQQEFQEAMGFNPSFFQRGQADAPQANEQQRNLDGVRSTARFPVEQVTWLEAVEFCNRLSQFEGLSPYYELHKVEWIPDRWAPEGIMRTAEIVVLGGDGYRLPTEAEWEYACRAGTNSTFYFDAQLGIAQANILGVVSFDDYPHGPPPPRPGLDRTTAVGSYAPNAFGLYDMHGNVAEWCQDFYSEGSCAQRNAHPKPRIEDPRGPLEGSWRVVRGGSFKDGSWSVRSASRSAAHPFHGNNYRVGFRVARNA